MLAGSSKKSDSITIRLRCVSRSAIWSRIFLVLLEVNLVRPPEPLPIHVPNVIPRHVLPVLRELDGDPLVRRAVHAGHQPFYDQTGAKVERRDPREGTGLEVLAVIGDGF